MQKILNWMDFQITFYESTKSEIKRKNQMGEQKNIFEISIEWVQKEAKILIGRKLTDVEILTVKKGIESGLLFDIETVFRVAIEAATEYNQNLYGRSLSK